MNPIMHALGLHLYQPYDNLQKLLGEDPGELRRILLCYERIGRYAHKYAGVAHIHLALSTVLLEQLKDPELIAACRDLADIPSILESLRSAPNIELIGTGFRHAPMPLIPPEDWVEQLQLEREAMSATFGRVLKGYWPPSSLFSMEMIRVLVKAGYEYLMLPSNMLILPDGSDADPYRPYKLNYKRFGITVIPIDGGFSQSQQYGLEAAWFADEVRNGVSLARPSTAPYLLTTWSDGENGEWFRGFEEQGFFGSFFAPYMEFSETGAFPVKPVSIPEYLKNHPAQFETALKPDYQPSLTYPVDPAIKKKLSKAVAQYWSLANALPGPLVPPADALLEARTLLLRAEESELMLGDAAAHAKFKDLLKQAEKLLVPKVPASSKTQAVNVKSTSANAKKSAGAGKSVSENPSQPVKETKVSITLPGSNTKTKPTKVDIPRPARKPFVIAGRPKK